MGRPTCALDSQIPASLSRGRRYPILNVPLSHAYLPTTIPLFCTLHRLPQYDAAISEYEKAVELQAGYVTAWNNLGDAYEATKQWRCACARALLLTAVSASL